MKVTITKEMLKGLGSWMEANGADGLEFEYDSEEQLQLGFDEFGPKKVETIIQEPQGRPTFWPGH